MNLEQLQEEPPPRHAQTRVSVRLRSFNFSHEGFGRLAGRRRVKDKARSPFFFFSGALFGWVPGGLVFAFLVAGK